MPKSLARPIGALAGCALVLTLSSASMAGPQYDQSPEDLKWVMERLKAWLPGEFNSFPQIYYERTTRMPEEGEHEYWHRSFALIDAPQVGDVVFYGQINVNGRSGSVLGGSQILYKAWIDEERGAVVINGQGPKDPGMALDLQDHPERWDDVEMRDPSSVKCDFLWRRDGDQIFGVLEGKTEERRKYGFGTCTYFSESAEAEFFADAEWVLTPDSLWIYDINTMGGQLFIGREDRTHTRLSRAHPYTCAVTDADGARTLNAYDRGFETALAGSDGADLSLLLLRAEFAGDNGPPEDALRLMLLDTEGTEIAREEAPPLAETIEVNTGGVSAVCTRAASFPPLSEAD